MSIEKLENSTRSIAYIGGIPSSPLGPIWVALSPHGLVAVEFPASPESITRRLSRLGYSQVVLDQHEVSHVLQQIEEYLAGYRRSFDLEIDWSIMRPFQTMALRETLAIPYGETSTYGSVARAIGKPGSARAVGRAEATNPMPLVIPCHRVLGSDGKLHGYGSGEGLETKAWLLNLEKGL